MEVFDIKKFFSLFTILIMMSLLIACNKNPGNQVTYEEIKQEEQVLETQKPFNEKQENKQSMIDSFIEQYNSIAPTPITDVSEIDVTKQESGHYRTEFRLGAFENCIAKTGKIGDIIIDVVNCGWKNDELRIYADGIIAKQATEIVKYAAPIMDPNVPISELQSVLDYLDGANDYHNGYFGNLCMTFNELRGELMLRTN